MSEIRLNLEETVEYLVNEYTNLANVVSATFGYMPLVKGIVSDVSNIPETHYDAGDAFLVGSSTPYNLYVYTGETWANVGQFPAVGPKGDTGVGTVIYTGSIDPAQSEITANDYDLYLNETNGNIYQYFGGSWIFAVNLTGAKGDRGEQGIQGERGPQGPTGERGPQGPAGDVSNVIVNGSSIVNDGVATLQTKTLFGNNSITGSGNIDLYRHAINVQISAISPLYFSIRFFIEVYSSNISTTITDMDGLINLLKESNGLIPATGYYNVYSSNAYSLYIISNVYANPLNALSIYYFNISTSSPVSWSNVSSDSLTNATINITDTVTTI